MGVGLAAAPRPQAAATASLCEPTSFVADTAPDAAAPVAFAYAAAAPPSRAAPRDGTPAAAPRAAAAAAAAAPPRSGAVAPGPLSAFPWAPLGNAKYGLLLAPFAVCGAPFAAHMLALALLRYAHAQAWNTVSRCRAISAATKITASPVVSFKQVDREANWDDYIILQLLVITAVHLLPGLGFSGWPAFSGRGLAMVLLLHAGPTELICAPRRPPRRAARPAPAAGGVGLPSRGPLFARATPHALHTPSIFSPATASLAPAAHLTRSPSPF